MVCSPILTVMSNSKLTGFVAMGIQLASHAVSFLAVNVGTINWT